MKTVILMCDGLGSRWIDGETKYKHLIEFDGVPLILRTIQQLQKYPCKIILAAPDEFKNYFLIPEKVLHTSLGYRETQSRTLLDGIWRTKDFWTDDTIIILGDVVFSNRAIHLIFSVNFPAWVLGRHGSNSTTGKKANELFSFSFNPELINIREQINSIEMVSGKLWDYFYIFEPFMIDPKDYTDDFDSPEAYKQFYDKMLEAVRGDMNE